MSDAVVGAPALARLQLRRDRLWWPLWVLVVVAVAVVTPTSYEELYPDPAARADLTRSIGGNGSLLALTGPAYDLSNAGGFVAWRVLAFLAATAGLAAILSVVRHTRAEEESGRMELLRSGVLGRHTSLASALAGVTGWALVIGALTTLGLVGVGLPVAGSALFGAGLGATAVAFGGVGALAAQVTEHARTARGLAGAVLGVAYLLRAAADASPSLSALGWVSPLGWPQRARPYAGDRWWVILLPLALGAVAAAGAFVLERRRDVGAGLVAARLGPADGRMGSVAGLVARLQRPSLVAWTVGILVFATAFGGVAPGLADVVDENPGMADVLRRMGGEQGLMLSFFAVVLPILLGVGMLHGVGVLARLDGEEESGRAELVLSTGASRRQLFLAHLAWAVGGAVLLAAAAGVGLTAGYALAGGREDLASDVLTGAMTYVGPVGVVIGVTALVLGLRARGTRLGWAYAGVVLLLVWVGALLRLPDAVLAISPFDHLPQQPGNPVAWTPLLVELALAAALMAAGLVAYRRRDLG
ncbi:ABC-2 type transport system permease protein [Barrientosiimonas humi]|uniref:ABC-2 type transport system permease protein n=1 Tax=Barrientosiimonas humi TaxID=999931 RepID=A0A542XG73_9MICO|nr:ABC transporter permease [Barrientosiimonas humi]TQL34829.1 ABC-2 type transport system permease protein [Barrientosiimonas humi]CAG7570971.1 hypothetical protein BH39T_PBIAJDOK_00129 [Barrientosiimonas humi]